MVFHIFEFLIFRPPDRFPRAWPAIVPELKFSLAGISSLLVAHRKSPKEAIDSVEQLISKPPGISGDTKPDIAGASSPRGRVVSVLHRGA